jgi:hypothetical protein
VTYQGHPSPRSVHPYGRDLPDEEYPGPPQRPPRGAAGGRGRRSRRSPWFWPAVGLAVVGALVVVAALIHGGGQGSASQRPGAMVTTFMPGEIQNVPAACTVVPGAVLDQYLRGRSKPAAAQPLEGKATSQCSWSVDRPGTYRFMALSVEAYAPNGLASGNGSATQAAQDAFAAAKVAKQFPPKKSGDPKAIVTTVPGLGQEAFSADQHFMRGALLDMVTLVARYRNVLVTVIFEARSGGRFGGDPVSTLTAGAQAAARNALAKLG